MLKSIIGNLPAYLEKTNLLSTTSSKWSKFKQTFATFFVSIMSLYGYGALYVSGFQKALDGTAFLSIISSITNIQQIFCLYNKNTINNMLETFSMFEKKRDSMWEQDIFRKESKWSWDLIHFYTIGAIGYVIFTHFVPIIVDSILGWINPNFPSLRAPLLGQGFIDFTEPRSMANLFASIPGVLVCILGICSHCGGQALTLVSISYLRAEQKILKQKLKIIKDLLNGNIEHDKDKVVESLADVVVHHQMIIKGLDNMNRVLGFPIFMQNTIVSICFCLNLYGTLAFEGKASTGVKLQCVWSSTLLAVVLFWACSVGESLENENSEVFQSIYDLPWYYGRGNVKNTVIMLLRQSRKQFVINYHQKAKLNLQTCMQILNASYSYFMVLKSTTN